MVKNNVDFIYSKISYRLYLFNKELWKIPEFVGQFLYDHNLAIKVYENITITSCNIDN